jgi:synaptojanin
MHEYAYVQRSVAVVVSWQVMSTDESTRKVWEEQVERALNADRKGGAGYILLRSAQLVGAALLVFCKAEHVDRITNVEARTCKVRALLTVPNRGTSA